jgi:sec-independent protein translocase protein TatA
MFGLGAGELLVIGVLALIFIGPKKLPELAKGLGKGIREFQKAKDEIMNDVDSDPAKQVGPVAQENPVKESEQKDQETKKS